MSSLVRTTMTLLVAAIGSRAARAQPTPSAPDSLFAQGLAAYQTDDLSRAFPLFEQAHAADPSNIRTQLYYAETARRLDRFEIALAQATAALGLEPCNSFAHFILGSLYSPQYSSWTSADVDSVWAHLRKAVECNPQDGNAWLPLWGEALRRGDRSVESSSLQHMLSSGILTPSYLALGRWLLESLPPDALVLTAGDLDHYPASAIQLVEHRRPDVAIVNESMLNAPWYAELVGQRFGLPLPVSADSLHVLFEAGGQPAGMIIRYWRTLAGGGRLKRPLAFALTTGIKDDADDPGALALEGPYFRVTANDGNQNVDKMEQALRLVTITDWNGPFVSPDDRSPVRRAHAWHPAIVPIYVSISLIDASLENDRVRAKTWLDWTQRLIAAAGLPADLRREYESELQSRTKRLK